MGKIRKWLHVPRTRLRKDLRKTLSLGFPGGTVVESLPANAGDAGLSPGLGRSHMPRSNWAREPQLLSLRVWSLCSATRQAAMVRGPRTAMKSGPRLPQLEKALAQKWRPNMAINQSIYLKKKKKKKTLSLHLRPIPGSETDYKNKTITKSKPWGKGRSWFPELLHH